MRASVCLGLQLSMFVTVGLAAGCESSGDGAGERGDNLSLLDAGAAALHPSLSCDSTYEVLSGVVTSDPGLLALRSCESDQDCTVVAGSFTCTVQGSALSICGVYAAKSQLAALQQRIDALQNRWCDDITRDCEVGAKCWGYSACVNHQCVAGSPDGGAR